MDFCNIRMNKSKGEQKEKKNIYGCVFNCTFLFTFCVLIVPDLLDLHWNNPIEKKTRSINIYLFIINLFVVIKKGKLRKT